MIFTFCNCVRHIIVSITIRDEQHIPSQGESGIFSMAFSDGHYTNSNNGNDDGKGRVISLSVLFW